MATTSCSMRVTSADIQRELQVSYYEMPFGEYVSLLVQRTHCNVFVRDTHSMFSTWLTTRGDAMQTTKMVFVVCNSM